MKVNCVKKKQRGKKENSLEMSDTILHTLITVYCGFWLTFLCFSGQDLKLLQLCLSRLKIAVSLAELRILEGLQDDVWCLGTGKKHVPAVSAVRRISAALQKPLSFVRKLSAKSHTSSAASDAL